MNALLERANVLLELSVLISLDHIAVLVEMVSVATVYCVSLSISAPRTQISVLMVHSAWAKVLMPGVSHLKVSYTLKR